MRLKQNQAVKSYISSWAQKRTRVWCFKGKEGAHRKMRKKKKNWLTNACPAMYIPLWDEKFISGNSSLPCTRTPFKLLMEKLKKKKKNFSWVYWVFIALSFTCQSGIFSGDTYRNLHISAEVLSTVLFFNN